MVKKQNQKYLALGIVALIFLALWFSGNLAFVGLNPPAFQTGTSQSRVISDLDRENYLKGIGRWNVLETCVDSLAVATTRTSATNYNLYWYGRQGDTWRYLETGNNKYATLTPGDGGYLWIVMAIPSGQAYYVDYERVLQDNEYCNYYEYVDVTGDGVKEFAFRYDMRNLPIPNSGYPSITFLGFLLTYDASFTGLNDLDNSTSIGTSTVTKFYSYYLAFAAAPKAVALHKVEVKVTSTDTTKVRLKKLNIPGLGYMDVSGFTFTQTASDYRWTLDIAKSFDGALYLRYPSNTNNRFDCTLSLEYTLTSSNDILITTTIYYLVAQTEAGTSTSDTFYAQT